MKHKLTELKIEQGQWSAKCSCGKWATALAATARAVRKEHKEHLKWVKKH